MSKTVTFKIQKKYNLYYKIVVAVLHALILTLPIIFFVFISGCSHFSINPEKKNPNSSFKDILTFDDTVLLKNGSRIQGRMEDIFPIDYSFGSVNFEDGEVSSIAFNEEFIQYTTFDGQNFIGKLPKRKIRFLQNVNDEKFSHQEVFIDTSTIDTIFLAKRDLFLPLMDDNFFTLFLQNGDRFPVIVLNNSLTMKDTEEREIFVDDIVYVKNSTGKIWGYLRGESMDKEFSFPTMCSKYLMVKLAKNGQRLTIPWHYVKELHNDRGKSLKDPLEFSKRRFKGMVYIPPGKFLFGKVENPYDQKFPLAKIKISGKLSNNVVNYFLAKNLNDYVRDAFFIEMKGFFIDEFEVSNSEYKKFIEATGHRSPPHWIDNEFPKGQEDFPVVNVSYKDSVSYSQWCKKRIPSEFEWERAAKGISGYRYPYGENYDANVTNNIGVLDRGHLKKRNYSSNAMPVYDMGGNVAELTSSNFVKNRTLTPEEDLLASSQYKVVRGGSFESSFETSQLTFRTFIHKDDFNDHTGFRCIKDSE